MAIQHDSRFEHELVWWLMQSKPERKPEQPQPKPIEGKLALGNGCWQAHAPHSD
jgi:hypothetical protein